MPRMPDHILRMIDANLNRCREGLRTMEDCARFMLSDEKLSERLKHTRHALRSAIDALGLRPDALLAVRDTPGDVGTGISTSSEQQRTGGVRDMVSAAAKRSTEALRVIEEAVKTAGLPGSRFESIRYELYDIERDLTLALHPECPQWSLSVLVSASLCKHHPPQEIIARAHAGGADAIQIREKSMPDSEMLEHSALLTQRAHALGMHVMVNDRAHIAKLVNADGVHLGQDDLPISSARALLGPGFWIGRSCPTLEHAKEAIAQGADTCGVGPIFSSSTKAKPKLAGVGLVESYLAEEQTQSTPVLAISGIDPSNIDQLAAVACPGVAVSSAVCSSEDPEGVCRTIVGVLARRGSADPTIVA